ncbi:MAG TPA: TadE/TadG family type IV pilus assembly protein [Azospirillaceae bacterium]|nr:TadE/TadG family type IV pilus assembly protein [Azospirillaceae bacterium]
MSAIKDGFKRLARGRRGNVAIETALVTPVAMLLLVGVIDYGMAVYDNMQLTSAVRAGAQYALRNDADLTTVKTVVMNALTIDRAAVKAYAVRVCGCANGTDVDCSDTCSDGSARRRFVLITAVQDHTALFTYPGIPNPVSLSAEARIRVE